MNKKLIYLIIFGFILNVFAKDLKKAIIGVWRTEPTKIRIKDSEKDLYLFYPNGYFVSIHKNRYSRSSGPYTYGKYSIKDNKLTMDYKDNPKKPYKSVRTFWINKKGMFFKFRRNNQRFSKQNIKLPSLKKFIKKKK